MPVISVFFGIVIRIFYREHGLPHFHAEYQGQQATFTFDGNPLAGTVHCPVQDRGSLGSRNGRPRIDQSWTPTGIG